MADLSDESKPAGRWIKVSVDFFEHRFFEKYPMSERDAWLWLVANAAWKSHDVRHGQKMITLDRGQCLAGRKYLAESWKWSEKKVRSFLDLLRSAQMIAVNSSETGRKISIVTICNYDKFQSHQKIKGQIKGQKRAANGPETGHTVEYTTNIIAGCRSARTRSEYEIAKDQMIAETENEEATQ